MMGLSILTERRTAADIVFGHLYDQITSLELLPGARISEAEIADRFGVSRQPVREAFTRLAAMELLLIQPQRATLVQKFSLGAIHSARFIRLGVELEVARTALTRWTPGWNRPFRDNLEAQETVIRENDARAFHALDEAFHRLIAEIADQPQALDLILEKKAIVDRICVLSLKQAHEMAVLVSDHREIYEALASGSEARLEAGLRAHLSRIEKTIEAVHRSHPEYFVD